ncbi:MAG: hypothetical protein LBD59_05500 [Prevotellaceae bacterium]|nr:hypothetical protein [Prevotellaceae bacterium]
MASASGSEPTPRPSPAGTAHYNRRFLHSVPIGTVVTRLGVRFLPTFRPYRDGLRRQLSEL